jgi:alkanesulfonate monooxygenase SsuD/methylene tetrahydromethanopterin reductase-like flavin-dependent oxidoreductase (luciferase family)
LKLAFGVHLSTHGLYDYGAFLKTAVLADSLGYDYITIGDHIFVVPERAGARAILEL